RHHKSSESAQAEAEAEAVLDGKSSKGINSTIAKTSRKPSSDQSGTPQGLSELQYGNRLMEEIQMPHTQANLRAVAAGIKSEAKDRGGLAQAYDYVLAQARAEIERSGTVTGFWFQDAKWRKKKPDGKPTVPLNSGLDAKAKAMERLKK